MDARAVPTPIIFLSCSARLKVVLFSAHKQSPQTTRLVSVRERALDQFAPPPQQLLTAMATDPVEGGIESACCVFLPAHFRRPRSGSAMWDQPSLPLKHGVLHFDKGTTTMNVVLLVASRLQSHPQESLR